MCILCVPLAALHVWVVLQHYYNVSRLGFAGLLTEWQQ